MIDGPTPRGERCCVPQARLDGSERSAQRENGNVRRPIRRRLFGGLAGRQACAAGWASADPWRQAQRAVFSPTMDTAKRGRCPLGLQQPAFGKRQDGAAGDDQVIEHPHIDQRQRRFQRLRQQLVGA